MTAIHPTHPYEPRSGPLDALTVRAFTVEEFCQIYRLCRTRFYQLWKDGELTPRKLGGRTVVPREEAERWFLALPTATKPEPSNQVS